MWEPTKSLHNLEVPSREVERYSSRRLPFRGSFINNLVQYPYSCPLYGYVFGVFIRQEKKGLLNK